VVRNDRELLRQRFRRAVMTVCSAPYNIVLFLIISGLYHNHASRVLSPTSLCIISAGDKRLHQRFRYPPMMMGLRIYRHLYGFPSVCTDFVVPEEPQWPIWMAGEGLSRLCPCATM
jgi:hypothetical protein